MAKDKHAIIIFVVCVLFAYIGFVALAYAIPDPLANHEACEDQNGYEGICIQCLALASTTGKLKSPFTNVAAYIMPISKPIASRFYVGLFFDVNIDTPISLKVQLSC